MQDMPLFMGWRIVESVPAPVREGAVCRGKDSRKAAEDRDVRSFAERHMAMTWAQRLKRVFNIDIEICDQCQGPLKVIACVEDPVAIRRILDHLKSKEASDQQTWPPPSRAPPQLGLFGA